MIAMLHLVLDAQLMLMLLHAFLLWLQLANISQQLVYERAMQASLQQHIVALRSRASVMQQPLQVQPAPLQQQPQQQQQQQQQLWPAQQQKHQQQQQQQRSPAIHEPMCYSIQHQQLPPSSRSQIYKLLLLTVIT